MKKVKKKIFKLLSSAKFLKEFKFWYVILMVPFLCVVNDILFEHLDPIMYSVLFIVLFVILAIGYRFLDDFYLATVFRDIKTENSKAVRNLMSIRYRLNRVNEENDAFLKTGMKYECSWKALRDALIDSNNLGMVEAMDKVESMIEENLKDVDLGQRI